MEKEYDYTIRKNNSPKSFKMACAAIENKYPELKKDDLLVDVDGSTIQIYGEEPKEVIVYDDYDVGAVFVKSDIDLSELFETKESNSMIA